MCTNKKNGQLQETSFIKEKLMKSEQKAEFK